MIISTLSFAMHLLVSSFKVFRPVNQVFQYLLPQFRNMATKAVKSKQINFDTKHLRKGDPLPPYNGTLRVYNMRHCPYAQRTILALNAKNIDYEVVNVHLMDKPEWLTQKSAFGKVPALEIADGVSIYESLVTVNYIDDVYPQRPLRSKDPLRRAEDSILIEATGPIQGVMFKLVKTPESLNDETLEGYFKAFDFIQKELKRRGTKYLSGAEPGYVDYMIWPWIERILIFQKFHPIVKLDEKKYKLLNEYIGFMAQDPAVAQYSVPDDALLKVMEGYKSGSEPDYDVLLKEAYARSK